MASPLDLGLLESFSPILSMLLVWVVIYGLFSYTKLFGDHKNLYALLGFVVALFFLFVPSLNKVMTIIVPWFTLLFIFVMLLLTVYGMFGAKEDVFLNELKTNKTISTWIIIISFTIFIAALSTVYFSPGNTSGTGTQVSPETGTAVSGEVGGVGVESFWATLFHPKVLGMIMILLIGTFTIMLLSSGGSS